MNSETGQTSYLHGKTLYVSDKLIACDEYEW